MLYTMNENEIIEYKKKTKEILKSFIKVCNQLNLRYFAGYGTLLGVVRHGGFIPWDDDIDVIMPRKDYEIFLKEGVKHLPKNLFLQNKESEKGYILNFSKLRDVNTTLVEKEYEKYDMKHGIFIDIFPLDGYKKGVNKYFDLRVKKLAFEQPSGIKGAFKKVTNISQSIILKVGPVIGTYVDLERTIKKMDEQAKKIPFDEAEEICDYAGSFYITPTPKSVFKYGKKMKFEDIEISVPYDCDTYLKLLYGDYMKLPPENERKPHHNFLIVDTKNPYTKYMKKNKKNEIYWQI